MSENLKHFTDGNFDNDVLKANLPVLVDFWAPWCGPCKMIGPMIEELADEYAGRVIVGKVNVDDSPEVAARYGIRGIPTIMFFKNGEVANQVTGAVPKETIERMFG